MSFKGEGVGKSWCGDGFTCSEPVGPGFFSEFFSEFFSVKQNLNFI